MPDPKIVEALESFSADVDGVPVSVSHRDRFYDDDPVVIGRRHLFGEVTVRSTRARKPASAVAVEVATAGPGERRTLGGPGRPRRAGGVNADA